MCVMFHLKTDCFCSVFYCLMNPAHLHRHISLCTTVLPVNLYTFLSISINIGTSYLILKCKPPWLMNMTRQRLPITSNSLDLQSPVRTGLAVGPISYTTKDVISGHAPRPGVLTTLTCSELLLPVSLILWSPGWSSCGLPMLMFQRP